MDPGIPHEVPDRPRWHEQRGEDIVPARPRRADAMGDVNVLYQFLAGWAQACDLRNRVEPRDEAAARWEYNVNEHVKLTLEQGDWFAEQFPSLAQQQEVQLYFYNGQPMTYEELMKRLQDSGGT